MEDVDLLSGEECDSDAVRTQNGISLSGSGTPNFLITHSSSSHLNVLVVTSAAVAGFGGLLFGYDIGIISGAELQLRNDFHFHDTQIEVVVTALLCGSLFASLVGGIIVDKIGRRLTMLLNTFIFIVGAFVLSFSQSFYMLVVGRFIVGFAVALSAVAECIYISEIAPTGRRGFLVSLNELGIAFGILLAYLMNYLLIRVPHGWRYMFGFSSIPALFQAIAMIFLPSSPRWLVSQGREEEAYSVAKRLWPDANIKHEITKMKLSLAATGTRSFLDLFGSADKLRRRMAIGCGLVFFQQITGQPTMLYYAPHLFKSLGFQSNVSATFATVGLGVVKVICTTVTLLFVDRFGRRSLLLAGSFLMTISVVAMCIATQPLPSPSAIDNCTAAGNVSTVLPTPLALANCTVATAVYPAAIKYTCLLSLMLFVAGYAIGFGPVSWLLLSEIFPIALRGRAVAITTLFNYGTNIVISLTFLDVIDAVGPSFMFLGYSLIGVLSIVFIFHFVPETKQKSLEQISQDLNSRTISCTVPICCRRRRVLHVRISQSDDYTSLMDTVEDQL